MPRIDFVVSDGANPDSFVITSIRTRINSETGVAEPVRFFARFAVVRDTLGTVEIKTQVFGDPSTPENLATVELGGTPRQGEVWTLVLDGHRYSHTVGFRETLSDIADAIGALIPRENTVVGGVVIQYAYDVFVAGRVISINKKDNSPITLSFEIDPDSKGGAVLTPQLLFTTLNWNKLQRVDVIAIDDAVIDGSDALVFPAMAERVNAIRGPLIIEGGIKVDEERFLNNPFRLPNETNFPLADGTLASSSSTPSGLATLTDPSALHINPLTGERFGFDPRMNVFPFDFTFLDGNPEPFHIDVAVNGVSGEILSVVDAGSFAVDFSATDASGHAKLVLTFMGTPVQSEATTIAWQKLLLTLNGTAKLGETWRLLLDHNLNGSLDGDGLGGTGTELLQFVVGADDTLGDIAQALAAALQAQAPGTYKVETRIGLLGDARLIISRKDGHAFRFDIEVEEAVGAATAQGRFEVSGTPDQSAVGAISWTQAALVLNTSTLATGDKLTLQLTPASDNILRSYTYVVKAADLLATDPAKTINTGWSRLIPSTFFPVVSGFKVTFAEGWEDRQHQDGDRYFIAPINLNVRASEDDQVDTLNVFNGNSPADDVGVLTSSHLGGLGMGGDTVVRGRTIEGGITYGNLEVLNIELGSGLDRFTIESTHLGTTTLNTGKGDDVIRVKTVSGHTVVTTGEGDDWITVSNDQGLVDQIAGLLAVDMGAGADRLDIDDSSDTNDNDGVLTETTLTGLDMPTVSEVQTITVRAREGTYELRIPTLGRATLPVGVRTEEGYDIVTLDYSDDAAEVAVKLQALYGFADLKVEEIRSNVDVTDRVTFIRGQAGIPQPTLEWAETLESTGLVANAGASANVVVAVVRVGTLETGLNNVQTIDVAVNGVLGGSFRISFALLNEDGELEIVTTAEIQSNATALELFRALSPILNPNGASRDIDPVFDALTRIPSRPFTDNVLVTKFGNVFQITFQGAYKDLLIHSITTATPAAMEVVRRIDGINYYGVETLNIKLGSGADRFSVQGTWATTVTNLHTGAGDDLIYVSSGALAEAIDQIAALDAVEATATVNFNALDRTITRTDGGSWVADGFRAGMVIYVTAAGGVPTANATGTDAYDEISISLIGSDQNQVAFHAGDVWSIKLNGQTFTYAALATDVSWSDIAAGLAAAIDDYFTTAVQLGGTIKVSGPVPFTVAAPDFKTTFTGARVAASYTIVGVTDSVLTLSANAQLITEIGMVVTVDQFVTARDLAAFHDQALHFARLDPDPTVDVVPQLRPGGTLDYVKGALNIQAGAGNNALSVSDRNDPDADTGVVITDHSITGLAPAVITYAANGGNFSGQGKWNLANDFGDYGRGVTIYAGTGGNKIDVQSIHTSGALNLLPFAREITTLFTGRGADRVTISVENDVGRLLVVQGEAGNDMINGSASSLPLAIFGDEGSDTIDGGSNADVIFGDSGRIYYLRPAGVPGFDIVLGGAPVDTTSSLTNDPNFQTPDFIRTVRASSTDANDLISGHRGNDIILAGGNGILAGGQPVEKVYGNSAAPDGSGYNDSDVVIGDYGTIALYQGGVLTAASTDFEFGGNDTIFGDSAPGAAGNDLLIGGYGADTIDAGDGNNIVLGDDGVIGYFLPFNSAPLLISTIESLSTMRWGGNDQITTGGGQDFVIAGRGNDIVLAGEGDNLVIGDSGQIVGANRNGDVRQFAGQPMVIDVISTITPTHGGNDTITTGTGRDIVFGGDNSGGESGQGPANADVITVSSPSAPNSTTDHNIVLGDDGRIVFIDWSHVSDSSSDIELIESLSTAAGGGYDVITSGEGDDILLGGRFSDAINGGNGNNLVFGDSGRIVAAAESDASRFYAQPITLGLVETLASLIGGADTITTGIGADIILGGIDGDTISANNSENVTIGRLDGRNIVIGDNGYIDWTAADPGRVYAAQIYAGGVLAGDDKDPSDIDRIFSTDPDHGGNDTITTGAGDDIIIGGEDGETVVDVIVGVTVVGRIPVAATNAYGVEGDIIVAGDGNNLVFGNRPDLGFVGRDEVPRHAADVARARYIGRFADRRLRHNHDRVGRDIVIGGIDADTIVANYGETALAGWRQHRLRRLRPDRLGREGTQRLTGR